MQTSQSYNDQTAHISLQISINVKKQQEQNRGRCAIQATPHPVKSSQKSLKVRSTTSTASPVPQAFPPSVKRYLERRAGRGKSPNAEKSPRRPHFVQPPEVQRKEADPRGLPQDSGRRTTVQRAFQMWISRWLASALRQLARSVSRCMTMRKASPLADGKSQTASGINRLLL